VVWSDRHVGLQHFVAPRPLRSLLQRFATCPVRSCRARPGRRLSAHPGAPSLLSFLSSPHIFLSLRRGRGNPQRSSPPASYALRGRVALAPRSTRRITAGAAPLPPVDRPAQLEVLRELAPSGHRISPRRLPQRTSPGGGARPQSREGLQRAASRRAYPRDRLAGRSVDAGAPRRVG
jgi:hypothetical protein